MLNRNECNFRDIIFTHIQYMRTKTLRTSSSIFYRILSEIQNAETKPVQVNAISSTSFLSSVTGLSSINNPRLPDFDIDTTPLSDDD